MLLIFLHESCTSPSERQLRLAAATGYNITLLYRSTIIASPITALEMTKHYKHNSVQWDYAFDKLSEYYQQMMRIIAGKNQQMCVHRRNLGDESAIVFVRCIIPHSGFVGIR